MPAAHFGVGAVSELPGVVRGSGCSAAVIVTDQALAGTPVVARVRDVLAADGMTTGVFAGVRPNPSTDDVAAGADVVAGLAAEPGRVAVVAVGGAVIALSHRAGMTHQLADFGITAADFGLIAADALDDEVMANTPRPPDGTDIQAILAGALRGAHGPAATRPGGPGKDGG